MQTLLAPTRSQAATDDALASAAFRCSPGPAFILHADRKVQAMNVSATLLHPKAFTTDVGGRLLVGRPVADAAILRCMQASLDGLGPTSTALMTGNLRFEERRCDVGVLAEAYRLTPAELRLLSLLLAGMAPKIAAGQVHASLHTVRTQIRSILLKSESPNLQVLLAKTVQLL